MVTLFLVSVYHTHLTVYWQSRKRSTGVSSSCSLSLLMSLSFPSSTSRQVSAVCSTFVHTTKSLDGECEITDVVKAKLVYLCIGREGRNENSCAAVCC